MEILDIYNENNTQKIGEEERSIVHKNNLWHREVGVLVINKKNEMLLQRRSHLKKQGANMLSITAGHLELNESEISAARRELKEEVGIDVKENDIIFLDIYRNEQENNNCFTYIYLVKTDKKIEDMIMQPEEVSELKYVLLETLEGQIKNQETELSTSKQRQIQFVLEKIKKYI